MLEKASVIKFGSTKCFCMEFVYIGDSSPLAQNDSWFDEIGPSLSVILEGVTTTEGSLRNALNKGILRLWLRMTGWGG